MRLGGLGEGNLLYEGGVPPGRDSIGADIAPLGVPAAVTGTVAVVEEVEREVSGGGSEGGIGVEESSASSGGGGREGATESESGQEKIDKHENARGKGTRSQWENAISPKVTSTHRTWQ